MYFSQQHVEKICKELHKLIYHKTERINHLKWQNGYFQRPLEMKSEKWQDFGETDRWGSYDGYAWFRASFVMPKAYKNEKVVLDLSVDHENWFADSRQFLLFINEELQQGMDVNHRTALIADQAKPGTVFQIDLQAYAGLIEKQTELVLQTQVEDQVIKKFYYDLHVPCQVAAELQENDKTKLDILWALEQVIQKLDLRKPYSDQFYQSIQEASAFLEKSLYQLQKDHSIQATAVGHTHIDVAWLWNLAQTRVKTARSFATVLQLMKEYPKYNFMSSQPQLYKFLKQMYPELYEKVKTRVAEGRWEAEGGMWVEADCNLVSGESFVRQFLYGKKYFKDEFGVDNRVLWLPDVFGYSAALPQIMKKSGIDYFMTTKINWNQYNYIPADTFNWQGIDGSSVLTHFITTGENRPDQKRLYFSTYNGYLAPRPVMHGWKRYQEKQIHEDILVAYGYGDGGGGTTHDMIERGMRMERGIMGCPKVSFGTVRDYFERTEDKVKQHPRLKKWVGELYFEYHRGTYTTMAKIKRFNRKAEILLQDVETFYTLASKISGISYPHAQIAECWETVLLNQFHDILPGSSIASVYEDSEKDYEQVIEKCKILLKEALNSMTCQVQSDKPSVIVFNGCGFKRDDLILIDWADNQPLPVVRTADGQSVTVQKSENEILMVAPGVPSKGYSVLTLTDDNEKAAGHMRSDEITADSSGMIIQADLLENRYWKIELDKQGHFIRLYDKLNQREVLPENAVANVLRVFEDKPIGNDNWDIDIYYQQKSWQIDQLEEIKVIESGPVRGGLQLTWRYEDSVIIQKVYIYDRLPRIDFQTWADWHEDDVLLKAEFPVEIHAQEATYDIQFGNVKRPTHWNTSWDWARFEVCAHQWVDLSETGYGVSLLNDCKYGHDIRDNVMRLTLIKCSGIPFDKADREEHQFTYSLLPHKGTWRDASTVQMARSLNQPLHAVYRDQYQDNKSIDQQIQTGDLALISSDNEHVMIETVKTAEVDGDIIVRLYEYKNQRGFVQISCLKVIDKIEACNLMEEAEADETLTSYDRQFTFYIKPYEIKTFKIKF